MRTIQNEDNGPNNRAALAGLACCLASCFCCFYIVFIGGFISYLFFGILFLIKDQSLTRLTNCSHHGGYLLYLYSLLSISLKLGLGFCLSIGTCCYRNFVIIGLTSVAVQRNRGSPLTEEMKQDIQWEGVKAALSFIRFYFFGVAIAFIAFGLYSMYGIPSCSKIHHSGLYVWGQITLWLDIFGVLLFSLEYFCFNHFRSYIDRLFSDNFSTTEIEEQGRDEESSSKYTMVPIEDNGRTIVSNKTLLPEWSVCHHFWQHFNVQFFHTEEEAQHFYQTAWGSRLIAHNNTIIAHSESRPLWEITIRQYWTLYLQREIVKRQQEQRELNSISSIISRKWSVCYHKSINGFYCELFDNETNARNIYKQCETWSTRLLAQGNVIIEEYHSNDNWKSVIHEYWKVYLDWQHRVDKQLEQQEQQIEVLV
jgi:hypothetical protein